MNPRRLPLQSTRQIFCPPKEYDKQMSKLRIILLEIRAMFGVYVAVVL